MFQKLKALTQLKKRLFPSFVSEKPVDPMLIYLLFERIHEDIPLYQVIATKELLDYFYPQWREFADKSVLGLITDRNDKAVRDWRKEVIAVYGNKCSKCGVTANLHAHHILSWAEYPEARTDIDNGICLCGDCHANEHPKMGLGMFNRARVSLQ